MIRPPGFRGAAFTTAAEGDLRSDPSARRAVAEELGISGLWATVHQIHGSVVRRVETAGRAGEGDALFTTRPQLPLAVFTADCLPIVLEADGGAGIAHAGWRGVEARVISRLREAMEAAGLQVVRAALGPGIGPCCFEVGPEVAARFGRWESATDWGTPSVDLWSAAADQLDGLDIWAAATCTHCNSSFLSHRRDRPTRRMAGLAWMP